MNPFADKLITNLKDFVGTNEESINRMIAVILKNLPKCCNQLSNSIKNENWKEIRFYAHKTKYSFRILQLQDEVNLLQEIEQMSEDSKDIYSVKKMSNDIIKKSDDICAALASRM